MKQTKIILFTVVHCLFFLLLYSVASAQGIQGSTQTDTNNKLMQAYQKLAGHGIVNAQVILARNFAVGSWGEQNLSRAAYWFEKAAEQGDRESQVILGWMYAEGKGVSVNSVRAVHWYRQAAVQGETKAMVNLAFNYTAGNGVMQDDRQAVFWLNHAAILGDPRAQFMLGVHMLKGKGVERNLIDALSWFQLAADQGHVKAQKAMALISESGLPLQGQKKIGLARPSSDSESVQPAYSGEICSLSSDCDDGYLCDERVRRCITNLEWIRKYPDI